MTKRAIFITSHTHPSVDSSLDALKKAFPEYEFDYVLLTDIFYQDKFAVAVNFLSVLKEYGWDILSGAKKVMKAFFSTTYFYNKIRKKLLTIIAGNKYDFSFQIGSLYDASSPGLPHFVYTDHTYLENLKYPDFKPSGLPHKKWLKLEAQIYKNATLNFTRSSNITASMINDYGCPNNKIACVYAGNNAKHNGGFNRDDKSYSSKKILFVGNFWERKGGPDLLRAFEKVYARNSDAALYIAGANPEIAHPGVKVLGKVPITELQKYYLDSAVFCLPTRWEPFGIVFLEAMSFKLPIVASNIGAIPDFIRDGENGYTVVPGDIQGLADRLILLIENPELCKAYGKRGYEIYEENYSWEKVSEKFKTYITPYITK